MSLPSTQTIASSTTPGERTSTAICETRPVDAGLRAEDLEPQRARRLRPSRRRARAGAGTRARSCRCGRRRSRTAPRRSARRTASSPRRQTGRARAPWPPRPGRGTSRKPPKPLLRGRREQVPHRRRGRPSPRLDQGRDRSLAGVGGRVCRCGRRGFLAPAASRGEGQHEQDEGRGGASANARPVRPCAAARRSRGPSSAGCRELPRAPPATRRGSARRSRNA